MHVSTLVNACNRHGGIHFLHEAGLRGTGVTNPAAFHDFCRSRLGIRDPTVARTAAQLVGSGSESIHVAKLVAVLRASHTQQAGRPPIGAASSHAGAAGCPSETSSDYDAGALHSRSVDDLAELLHMDRDELHDMLQRYGFGGDDPAARQEIQEVIRRIVHMDATQFKLPQGLDAPHVCATHQEEAMSYKVPVWSLRAMNQKARSGRLSRATSSAPLPGPAAPSAATCGPRLMMQCGCVQRGGCACGRALPRCPSTSRSATSQAQ